MPEKKPIHHIVAGLLTGLPVVLVSLVFLFSTGTNTAAGIGWINVVVILAGLIFFVQQYGKAIDYRATFGDYFNYGFKATTMIVLLYVVYLLILSFTLPEIKQNAIETERMLLQQQKAATEKEIQNVMEIVSKNFWLLLIGTCVFLLVLIGAVGSLIGAATTKKLSGNSSEQTSI